jgi:hypothetical protein
MALFASLDPADKARSLIQPAGRRMALLTGQSAPANTVLSPEQVSFMHQVVPAGFEVLGHGYPFHAACERGPHERTSIASASLNNARQFMAALGAPRFRRQLRWRLGELIERTSESLIIITGSGGLQLLNAVWSGLAPIERSISVVALGPACLGPIRVPRRQLVTIRGSRDGWSRMLYRGPIDHGVACGHLGYWSSPEVIGLVRGLLAAKAAEPA